MECFILDGWAVASPGGNGLDGEVREPGAHLVGRRLRGVKQDLDGKVIMDTVTTEVVRAGKYKGWHAVQTETGRYYLLGATVWERMGNGVGNVSNVR